MVYRLGTFSLVPGSLYSCRFPVLKDAYKSIIKGDVFSEFFLMSIATIGAFAIGEYPEGVAVMLFYAVGEVFQSMAVTRAKGNIKALLISVLMR
jgi:Cd2+/Zn2+-exporting ATPase